MFQAVLRGGPLLAGDDERARLVDLREPETLVTVTAADGEACRFRIANEYELVAGHERWVYRYVDESHDEPRDLDLDE